MNNSNINQTSRYQQWNPPPITLGDEAGGPGFIVLNEEHVGIAWFEDLFEAIDFRKAMGAEYVARCRDGAILARAMPRRQRRTLAPLRSDA